jgi:hypothetical protein
MSRRGIVKADRKELLMIAGIVLCAIVQIVASFMTLRAAL